MNDLFENHERLCVLTGVCEEFVVIFWVFLRHKKKVGKSDRANESSPRHLVGPNAIQTFPEQTNTFVMPSNRHVSSFPYAIEQQYKPAFCHAGVSMAIACTQTPTPSFRLGIPLFFCVATKTKYE